MSTRPVQSGLPTPTRLTITVPPISLTTPRSVSTVEQTGIPLQFPHTAPAIPLLSPVPPTPVDPFLLTDSMFEPQSGSPLNFIPMSPVGSMSFGDLNAVDRLAHQSLLTNVSNSKISLPCVVSLLV